MKSSGNQKLDKIILYLLNLPINDWKSTNDILNTNNHPLSNEYIIEYTIINKNITIFIGYNRNNEYAFLTKDGKVLNNDIRIKALVTAIDKKIQIAKIAQNQKIIDKLFSELIEN